MDLKPNDWNINDQKYFPFAYLNKDIANLILKQLEFREYLNLALTCRNWFQLASSAPRSCKPTVYYDLLATSRGVFSHDSNKFSRIEASSLKLINNIQCEVIEFFQLEDDDLSRPPDYLKFVMENRSQVKVLILHLYLLPSVSYNTDVFKDICNMAQYLYISYDRSRSCLMSYLDYHIPEASLILQTEGEVYSEIALSEDISRVIEEKLTNESIFLQLVDKELCKTILMQMFGGERPGLQYFHCLCSDFSMDELRDLVTTNYEIAVIDLSTDYLCITNPNYSLSFEIFEDCAEIIMTTN